MICKVFSHYPHEINSLAFTNQPVDSITTDINIQQSADATVSEAKDEGNEEQDDSTVEMQVARIGLSGVILGALITGFISVLIVLINSHEAKLERENHSQEAQKERDFIRSQTNDERTQTERRTAKEKKTEVYLNYLQLINEVTYQQLENKKQGKTDAEIKSAQKNIIEKMVLSIAGIQMYGSEEIYTSAKKLFKHIDNCRIDSDDYKQELTSFLTSIKNDIITP